MEEINAVTIYWLISIGLLTGYIMDLILIKRGVGTTNNLIGGVVGSVIIGVSVISLNLYGPLVYAAIGSVTFLFLINVFSFHQEERTEASTD